MGCYQEKQRARMGTWATRSSWRSAIGNVGTRGESIHMGSMILCAAVLATLLMIRGLEPNPRPADNILSYVVAATGTWSRELNVNLVADGITAVEMLSFKLRRARNGTATDVDLRDTSTPQSYTWYLLPARRWYSLVTVLTNEDCTGQRNFSRALAKLKRELDLIDGRRLQQELQTLITRCGASRIDRT